MDIPASILGWLNLFGHLWALLAYATAAVAGVRVMLRSYERTPARPSCLIVDTTRWVFGLRTIPRNWDDRDFICLGVFGVILACVVGVANEIEFLSGFDWRKLGGAQSLQQAGGHILTGSALIVLLRGVALYVRQRCHDGR